MLATGYDVTTLVESKMKIAEAEERARLAMEAAGAGTFDLNYITNELITSPRFDAMFGFSEPKKMNDYFAMIHPEDLPIRNAAIEKALRTEKISYEVRFVWADNSVHWLRINGRVYCDSTGTPLRMIGIGVDVTDAVIAKQRLFENEKQFREELEVKIKERTFELERSNDELQQFAYVASHDLQEPLRKIETYTDMLHKSLGVIAENSKSYIDRISKSTSRMAGLIKDLLHFSSVTKTDLVFKPVDLNNVLKEVLVDFELLIEEKQALIQFENLPVIQGIPLQMNQLFNNLLSNSLKFSDQQRAPRITIAAKTPGYDEVTSHAELNPNLSFVKIEWEDNGIGFKQQYAQQIFEIFQRLNDRHKYAGSGIGLAICKRIATNHKGQISATSKQGKGTTFHIFLPL